MWMHSNFLYFLLYVILTFQYALNIYYLILYISCCHKHNMIIRLRKIPYVLHVYEI